MNSSKPHRHKWQRRDIVHVGQGTYIFDVVVCLVCSGAWNTEDWLKDPSIPKKTREKIGKTKPWELGDGDVK